MEGYKLQSAPVTPSLDHNGRNDRYAHSLMPKEQRKVSSFRNRPLVNLEAKCCPATDRCNQIMLLQQKVMDGETGS